MNKHSLHVCVAVYSKIIHDWGVSVPTANIYSSYITSTDQ